LPKKKKIFAKTESGQIMSVTGFLFAKVSEGTIKKNLSHLKTHL
jgi:hypothetical protein